MGDMAFFLAFLDALNVTTAGDVTCVFLICAPNVTELNLNSQSNLGALVDFDLCPGMS